MFNDSAICLMYPDNVKPVKKIIMMIVKMRDCNLWLSLPQYNNVTFIHFAVY